MSESEPRTGRPPKELRGDIIDVLKTTDHRAMTLGMITNEEEIDGARATVKKRLDDLLESGEIKCDKIGNATAYWYEEPEVKTSGGINRAWLRATLRDMGEKEGSVAGRAGWFTLIFSIITAGVWYVAGFVWASLPLALAVLAFVFFVHSGMRFLQYGAASDVNEKWGSHVDDYSDER